MLGLIVAGLVGVVHAADDVAACVANRDRATCAAAWQEADLDWAWAVMQFRGGQGSVHAVNRTSQISEDLRQLACRAGHAEACQPTCDRNGQGPALHPCRHANACDDTPLGVRWQICGEYGGDHVACDLPVEVFGWVPFWDPIVTRWGVLSLEENVWTDARGRVRPLFEPDIRFEHLRGLAGRRGVVALYEPRERSPRGAAAIPRGIPVPLALTSSGLREGSWRLADVGWTTDGETWRKRGWQLRARPTRTWHHEWVEVIDPRGKRRAEVRVRRLQSGPDERGRFVADNLLVGPLGSRWQPRMPEWGPLDTERALGLLQLDAGFFEPPRPTAEVEVRTCKGRPAPRHVVDVIDGCGGTDDDGRATVPVALMGCVYDEHDDPSQLVVATPSGRTLYASWCLRHHNEVTLACELTYPRNTRIEQAVAERQHDKAVESWIVVDDEWVDYRTRVTEDGVVTVEVQRRAPAVYRMVLDQHGEPLPGVLRGLWAHLPPDGLGIRWSDPLGRLVSPPGSDLTPIVIDVDEKDRPRPAGWPTVSEDAVSAFREAYPCAIAVDEHTALNRWGKVVTRP